MDTSPLKKAERSRNLIANFIEGFADGWYMALQDSFKVELDIKLTERKKDKISYYEWIQGPYYCFSEGQLIYDAREAYTHWQNGLKKINLACQIVAAKPNIPIKIVNEVTDKTEYRVLDGYVKFLLFKPDEGHTRLVPYVGYNFSQNDFVNFLKTGELEEKNYHE
ncbi:hypothetical protein [Oryzomonas rubra]|uniref:Uncharacterized protein n=1 Tax=Oryzomonas rubra TaxID=2509454 RepID=A0A5A9XKF3_9BACT|nr:hypothetical protein [Oryzomonas rubra]KAA0893556.1 hypothetical protein ET418_07035 [Oryzomonas rubra]